VIPFKPSLLFASGRQTESTCRCSSGSLVGDLFVVTPKSRLHLSPSRVTHLGCLLPLPVSSCSPRDYALLVGSRSRPASRSLDPLLSVLELTRSTPHRALQSLKAIPNPFLSMARFVPSSLTFFFNPRYVRSCLYDQLSVENFTQTNRYKLVGLANPFSKGKPLTSRPRQAPE
jgi:hypothetical protein